jgi:hypothetical protein
MKVLLLTVLAVLICSASSTSRAQEPSSASVRYNLPVVLTTKNTLGEEVKCLSVDQWQTVLKIANEYHGLYDWRLKIEGVLETHQQVITVYERMAQNYEQIIKLQNQDREYLTLRLKQEMDSSKNVGFQNRLEKYGLWVVVVAETLTLGILGARELAIH